MRTDSNKIILTKFTGRERMLILTTLAVIISTICYGFIIEPLVSAYSKINRQISTNIRKLQRNHKLIARKEIIIAEYEKYANLIKPLSSDEEEIAAMLKAIEVIGRKSNIHISNIRPQPVKDEARYRLFTFELSAETGIVQLVRFIYDLQTSGNLLRVTKLTLSATSAKKRKKELKAVMEITKPSLKSL